MKFISCPKGKILEDLKVTKQRRINKLFDREYQRLQQVEFHKKMTYHKDRN